MESTGATLALNDSKVFQGGNTHNGFLLKLHSFDLVTGISKLTYLPAVPPKFGFGVWLAGNARDNKATTIMPGTNPQPLGILLSNGFVRQGQPAAPDTIQDWNKVGVAVRGYVRYKTGYTTGGVESQGFSDITKGMLLCINQANGQPHFAASAPGGFTAFGKVVLLNPDDRSWTVEITA